LTCSGTHGVEVAGESNSHPQPIDGSCLPESRRCFHARCRIEELVHYLTNGAVVAMKKNSNVIQGAVKGARLIEWLKMVTAVCPCGPIQQLRSMFRLSIPEAGPLPDPATLMRLLLATADRTIPAPAVASLAFERAAIMSANYPHIVLNCGNWCDTAVIYAVRGAVYGTHAHQSTMRCLRKFCSTQHCLSRCHAQTQNTATWIAKRAQRRCSGQVGMRATWR